MRFQPALLILIFLFGFAACNSNSPQGCCTTMESGARDALRRCGFQADSMSFRRPSPNDSTLIYTFVSNRADVDRLIHGFALRPYDTFSHRYLRSQREADPLFWRNDSQLFWAPAPGRSLRFSLQMNFRTSESEIELLFDRGDSSLADANGAFLGSLGRGDTTTFKTTLKSGIDLNAPTVSGSTVGIEALILAYVRQEMALVRELLEMGVPPCDPVGLDGNALVQPIYQEDIATLSMFLEWHPEWNGPCIVEAARVAVSEGNVEILDLLVTHGLDINVLTPTWGTLGKPFDPEHPAAHNCAQTLLMVAANRGHVDCVDICSLTARA